MSSRSLPRWRVRLVAAVGLLLVACGTSGETILPDDPGTGVPTGRLSGTILVSDVATGADPILEAEPNDTVDTAHRLGEIRAGQTLVVHGHTTAIDDSDPFDGFELIAMERVKITATLQFPDGAMNDFDMGVFDPLGSQFVEVFIATTAPEVGIFHAKGTFLLVVNAYSGEGDYVLTITASLPEDPIPEREPNDASTQGQYLGELRLGDALSVAGSIAALDAREGVFVSCPDACTLYASLGFLPGRDYDLYITDASVDIASPTIIASLESSTANPEVGNVTIPGGTLLYVEVSAWDGTGPWTLTLRADPSTALVAKTRVEEGADLASLTAERSRWKGRAGDALFARPSLEFVPGEVLIGLEEDDDSAAFDTQAAKAGAQVRSRVRGAFTRLGFPVPDRLDDVDRARFTLSRVAALRGSPGVAYAEPNYIYQAHAEPDDTYYNLQWHYPLIHLEEAWDLAVGSSSVTVAVIDTGRTNHPDLVGRQVGGYDFISDASNARDGDGQDADPTDVGDESNPDGTSSFHGTHVAGTIGATTDNDRGVAGVTWATEIMHLRVLGRTGGTIADIADAIRYAARLTNGTGALPAQRADVINMSLGGGGYTDTLQSAITAARNAGVVIFASAGNEATSSPSYPAAHAGVMSVVAVDLNADLAPYSNYGSTVDIAAPGGDTSRDRNGDGYSDGVLSTMFDDGDSPPTAVYAFYQGTSMACPHAAGVAALLLGVDPTLTPDQVESIMTSTAEDLGTTGRDNTFGHGLINAYAAVQSAMGGASGAPVLQLSPTALNFGGTLSSLDVTVLNGGAEFLQVTSVTPITQSGGPWLTASIVGSGDATRDADTVRVTVDRTSLPSGSYSGRVVVDSNGGSREIQVLMSTGVPALPLDVDIYVLAIDPDTYETVEEVVVNPTTNLDYFFAALPAGTYLVAAGTDIDDDGFICDEGEFCGMYPVMAQPVAITVSSGATRSGVDFGVEPDDPIESSAAVPDGKCCTFRRLGR